MVFIINGAKVIGHPQGIKKKELHLNQINPKWIMGLNVKHKNMKLLEDSIETTFRNEGLVKSSQTRSKAQFIKERNLSIRLLQNEKTLIFGKEDKTTNYGLEETIWKERV